MGLLDKLKASSLFLRITRFIQFLSATISLGLYSSRVYFLLRKIQRLRTATGAVEGILACSVAYTIAATLIQCLQKATNKGGGNHRQSNHILRWALVVLDILFVGAFIAVATLTRPNGGPAGPCTSSNRFMQEEDRIAGDKYCHLPLGTFILAILSTLLHAITAAFHDHKDQKHEKEDWASHNDDMMSRDHAGMSRDSSSTEHA